MPIACKRRARQVEQARGIRSGNAPAGIHARKDAEFVHGALPGFKNRDLQAFVLFGNGIVGQRKAIARVAIRRLHVERLREVRHGTVVVANAERLVPAIHVIFDARAETDCSKQYRNQASNFCKTPCHTPKIH